MPRFVVSPATVEDAPQIAAASRAAFKDSPDTVTYWILPQENEDANYQWRLRGVTNIIENENNSRFFKCVDVSNNKLVSYALWQRPHAPKTEEEEKAKKEAESQKKRALDEVLPPGSNAALLHDLEDTTLKTRSKYVNPEKDYVLCALGTLPEYQGKGCASLLLESNLKDVDAQGARVFLEATPQGRPLYEKLGWESIDEMVFDLSRYGVNNVQTVTCMVRKERLDVTKS